MTETEALTRRHDELTDLEVPNEGIAVPVLGIRSADELPRDGRGRVLGVWHIAETPASWARTLDDDVTMHVWPEREQSLMDSWAALKGDLVDRAVSLGCTVAPGVGTPTVAE